MRSVVSNAARYVVSLYATNFSSSEASYIESLNRGKILHFQANSYDADLVKHIKKISTHVAMGKTVSSLPKAIINYGKRQFSFF